MSDRIQVVCYLFRRHVRTEEWKNQLRPDDVSGQRSCEVQGILFPLKTSDGVNITWFVVNGINSEHKCSRFRRPLKVIAYRVCGSIPDSIWQSFSFTIHTNINEWKCILILVVMVSSKLYKIFTKGESIKPFSSNWFFSNESTFWYDFRLSITDMWAIYRTARVVAIACLVLTAYLCFAFYNFQGDIERLRYRHGLSQNSPEFLNGNSETRNTNHLFAKRRSSTPTVVLPKFYMPTIFSLPSIT